MKNWRCSINPTYFEQKSLNQGVLQSSRLDWSTQEAEFAGLYFNTGRPAHPLRLMVSLLLLKQMYGHVDESLPGVWVQNPYYQYLSGMDRFQWWFPVALSDRSHFRKRLGSEGDGENFGW